MRAAFAILVFCLVALLPESRADAIEASCLEEFEMKIGHPFKDTTPEEREKSDCNAMCILKKRGYLKDGDDIFDEKLFLKYIPDDEKELFLKSFGECKEKKSGNECRFLECLSAYCNECD